MADNDAEKTEEATQTRREEFRRTGQVVQSKEITSALYILIAAFGIYFLGQFFFAELHSLLQFSFGNDLVEAVRKGDISTIAKMSGVKFALLVAPIFGISLLIAIASTVVQVGFLNVEDAISVKPEKLNPIAGFGRIFSFHSLAEGLKALLKFVFIGVVVYLIIKSEMLKIPTLIDYSVNQLFGYLGVVVTKLLGGIGVAMTILSIGDYFFQKWELDKKMMMTKQEIKDENKNKEGDPLIKARIRKIQREVANRRMMEKVPKADVIITNPTHIAVALRYSDNLPAPQLIAKGADLVAEKIKEIAREHNIPIIENKPLARTIFKTLKIGQVIPRELFVTVAEVLAYVFKLRRKAKR